MKRLFSLLVFGAFLLINTIDAQVWYISPEASGNQSGESWTNSSSEIHEIVKKAIPGDQLHFLEGSYDCKSWSSELFAMIRKKQLSMYGGFNGTESSISDRFPRRNTSVLRNLLVEKNNQKNKLHLKDSPGYKSEFAFDGFAIESSSNMLAKDEDCFGSMGTLFDSDPIFAGNMFDVLSAGTVDVIIEGFDVNLTDEGEVGLISVYYRPGTYIGFEESSEGWTLMGSTTVTSQGVDNPTYVDIGGLEIKVGETYGMYVTVSDYPSVSMAYSTGNISSQAQDLTILAGVGKGSPDFVDFTIEDRWWNGNIYYNRCQKECEFLAQEGNINCENGSSECDDEENTYTVVSEGCFSSSSTSDMAAFAQQEMCGDGTLEVEVISISNKGWAGIQMRESNAPGSKMVGLKTQLTNFLLRESRAVTNGLKKKNQLFRPNASWLRISRNGNNFQCFSSKDGVQWQFAMSVTIPMPECIEIGMFVESINSKAETEAVFGNVNVLLSENMEAPDEIAIEQVKNAGEISVYPNPGHGQFTIDRGGLQGEIDLFVRDMRGNIIQKVNLKSDSELVNLNLPAGAYLFQFIGADGMQSTQRVISQ